MNKFDEIVEIKTNDELLKMAYEFDEWSPDMLKTVEVELSKRNILPADINERKWQLVQKEDKLLAAGRDASTLGLIVGWVTVLGLFGIYMGYRYTFSKTKSRYTNKEYFTYNESSRKNGSYLFYTAVGGLICAMLYGLLKQYQ